jgi:phosphotransferase system  glucose/maltose/N-acetylglucosamine-specific IIC component
MALENLLAGFVRSLLKRIIMGVLGALLGVFGVAVLSIGLIKYLAWLLHMEWAAWVIVGLALALAGAVIFYSAVPRRK